MSSKLKSCQSSICGERESNQNNRITDKLTVQKKEMKDHFQTEDTLNNKEVKSSATKNLKCLYLCADYFAQPENFTTFFC